VRCPQCQHETPPGAKFCIECVSLISCRCPTCDSEAPAAAKFCLECTAPLTTKSAAATLDRRVDQHPAATILQSETLLDGERKTITALFVRLTRPLGALTLPATVQGMLAASIDRLPPDQKELRQTLAVLGKEFTFSLVRAVTGRGDDDLKRLLGELQLAEFILQGASAGERSDQARTMLAEIYNNFAEGFDTVDLKEAKALLEEPG
jgi:hypothetical protein